MKKLLFLTILPMMLTFFSCSKNDDNGLDYLGKWFIYRETEDYGDDEIYTKEFEGCHALSNFEFFPDNTVVHQDVTLCNDDGGYGLISRDYTYSHETRKLVDVESGEELDVRYSGNEMTITVSFVTEHGGQHVTHTFYCRRGD